MTQTLRATVAEIDPLLALQQVQTMNDVISNVEAPRRFNTYLIAALPLGALLLAITGIYAVVAFSVSLRTQEIAIRMALGAQRAGSRGWCWFREQSWRCSDVGSECWVRSPCHGLSIPSCLTSVRPTRSSTLRAF